MILQLSVSAWLLHSLAIAGALVCLLVFVACCAWAMEESRPRSLRTAWWFACFVGFCLLVGYVAESLAESRNYGG